jgi:hypothetical protein
MIRKNRRETVEAMLELAELERPVLTGYDDCIIGLDEKSMRVVYSKEKICQALCAFCKTRLEALEFYEFNILPVADGLDIVIVDDMIF